VERQLYLLDDNGWFDFGCWSEFRLIESVLRLTVSCIVING